jgi:hypothetical protein
MLQAHSFLWHYLWIAPNLLLLVLASILWKRKLHKEFPLFQIFAVVLGAEQLTLYVADVIPSVSAGAWWRIFWVGLLVEALVKFSLIGEIFARVFGHYDSLATLGKRVIRGFGVALVLVASVTAAYAPVDNPRYTYISYAHILDQTIYMVECGLLVFIFLFAAYFGLRWSRASFGITFGLAVSACVHLATWAVMANGGMMEKRHLLDLLNMATYHISVLIWYYFLLAPEKRFSRAPKTPPPKDPPPPEHDLEVWNQELERLLHQ